MLNRAKAREVFQEYVKQFDMNNIQIVRKINHSLRVADLCVSIADSIFLSKEETELLYMIGLFHDIGHFAIIKQYGSKMDMIDHADYGLKVLFDEKLINKIDKSMTYDSLIQTTIFSHNKVVIPENYDEKQKTFARVLRDADKLDIFNEIVNKEIDIPVGHHDVTPEVWELFKNYQPIANEMLKTDADHLLKVIAYIYDINYKFSLFIIKNNEYIKKILDTYRNKTTSINVLLDLIVEVTNKYIRKRMDEYVR